VAGQIFYKSPASRISFANDLAASTLCIRLSLLLSHLGSHSSLLSSASILFHRQRLPPSCKFDEMSNDAQLQGVLEAYYALTPDQQSIFSQLSATPSPSTTPQSLSPINTNSPASYKSPQPVAHTMVAGGRTVTRTRGRQGQDAYHKKRPLNAFMAFRCKFDRTEGEC
jgi:hypothetical protein